MLAAAMDGQSRSPKRTLPFKDANFDNIALLDEIMGNLPGMVVD
jgi:hypothetical protein